MMAALGEYIFCVTATALLCGIVCTVLKDCGVLPLVKLICGLILMLCVLRPAVRLSRLDLTRIPGLSDLDGTFAVEEGRRTGQNARAAIIKQETEAYILDKAAELGLELTVQVTLSEDDPPLPVSVVICGPVSPYEKLRLEEWIQEKLNIAKENLLWTG